jgi:hypothetical protein
MARVEAVAPPTLTVPLAFVVPPVTPLPETEAPPISEPDNTSATFTVAVRVRPGSVGAVLLFAEEHPAIAARTTNAAGTRAHRNEIIRSLLCLMLRRSLFLLGLTTPADATLHPMSAPRLAASRRSGR